MNSSKSDKDVGKKIKVLSCAHADIRCGMIGVVRSVDNRNKGYWVEFTGEFLISGANAKRETSTEQIFIGFEECEFLLI